MTRQYDAYKFSPDRKTIILNAFLSYQIAISITLPTNLING